MNLDLDAFLAAQAEAIGEQTLTFKGETFSLPHFPGFRWGEEWDKLVSAGNVKGCIDMLLGEEAEKFWALDPPLAVCNHLIGRVPLMLSGLDLGESGASGSTSGSTSGSSRPSSKPATRSTSPRRSGAKKRSA